MKKSNILFLPTLLFIIFSVSYSFASVNFVDAGLSEVRAMAAREGKLYFAHFSAEWCMPCQWMEKNTFKDPRLSHYTNQNYFATILDVDDSEGQWYQNQYSVATLPTILIFSSQGVLLDRIETSVEAEELLAVLERLNKPGNRVSTQPLAAQKTQVKVLDSPKANFVFSRPALIPDNSNRQEGALPQNQPIFASRQSPPPLAVVQTAPFASSVVTSFTPKAAARTYYVEAGVFTEYKNAIGKVQLLEKDFEQPVILLTQKENGQLYYYVTIGQFFSKAKAKDFLHFLFRNDVEGVLKEK